jgi:glycosyltransferase involved in cell wall biosynthesis
VPEALLTVIGKNPPLELQSQSHPIPAIDVTGYVDNLERYLAETAVFIVPLHAGGGMRVKILDAWSWGLPVVSTTIGAEGLNAKDGHNLLVGDDAQTFAEAVVRVLKDRELADELSDAGRRTVESKYDWRKAYRAWDRVYGAPYDHI